MVSSERIALTEFVENVLREKEDEFGDKFSGLINTLEELTCLLLVQSMMPEGDIVGAVLVVKSQEGLAQQVREETLGQVGFLDLLVPSKRAPWPKEASSVRKGPIPFWPASLMEAWHENLQPAKQNPATRVGDQIGTGSFAIKQFP